VFHLGRQDGLMAMGTGTLNDDLHELERDTH
jgi:hypothetical protein